MNLGSEVQHVEIPLLNFEASRLDKKVDYFDNPRKYKETYFVNKAWYKINGGSSHGQFSSIVLCIVDILDARVRILDSLKKISKTLQEGAELKTVIDVDVE